MALDKHVLQANAFCVSLPVLAKLVKLDNNNNKSKCLIWWANTVTMT